jgi:hypothetical protein
MGVAQSRQLRTLFLLHASQLLSMQRSQIVGMLGERRGSLPLLVQHLVRNMHVRHASVACSSGLLPNGLLLSPNNMQAFLAFICVLLIASELGDFWSVPEMEEGSIRQLQGVVLLQDLLSGSQRGNWSKPFCTEFFVAHLNN